MQETWVQSLSQKDLLEKEMATQSKILAWKVPRTEKPGGLQSMGSQRIGHGLVTKQHQEVFQAKTMEKLKAPFSFSSVAQSCPTLCDPMDCSLQASLSITNSQSLLKLMSIESVMPSNHLIQPSHPLSFPFSSCLQSFPASGSFQMSQLFSSGGQSTFRVL